jgi:branched-chain amino acid transport system ATP-binding protein
MQGEIRLNGHTVTAEPAQRRPARGMGRTFQVPRPFGALSVLENVMLGAQNPPGEQLLTGLLRPAAVRRSEQQLRDEAMRWLEFTTLAPLARQPARVLSIGQRKLLELARLLIATPSMILLDEPMAGVQPRLIETLSERLSTLAQSGTTVLLVEHQLSLIASLCQRVLVMAQGKLLTSGAPSTVLADARVAEAYLGMAAP